MRQICQKHAVSRNEMLKDFWKLMNHNFWGQTVLKELIG